jgi:hypothetical protein
MLAPPSHRLSIHEWSYISSPSGGTCTSPSSPSSMPPSPSTVHLKRKLRLTKKKKHTPPQINASSQTHVIYKNKNLQKILVIQNKAAPPPNCQESSVLPSTPSMNDDNPDLMRHELYLPLVVPFRQMKTFLPSTPPPPHKNQPPALIP